MFFPASVMLYATHFPSGENEALRGFTDTTPPKTKAFLSAIDTVHNVTSGVVGFVTKYNTVSPAQDCAICELPFSGVVRRSAWPLPSMRWEKMLTSPSRSDENAILS